MAYLKIQFSNDELKKLQNGEEIQYHFQHGSFDNVGILLFSKIKEETKPIYLVVGPSGSGKTSLQDYLVKNYGWKSVESYTTRNPRYEGEKGHIFIKDRNDLILNAGLDFTICAYTKFNDCEYWATTDQVDEADIYVIDPDGVKYFLDSYNGFKIPVIVYLDADPAKSLAHMIDRGDNFVDAAKRIVNDSEIFEPFRDSLLNGDFDSFENIFIDSDHNSIRDMAIILNQDMIKRGKTDE